MILWIVKLISTAKRAIAGRRYPNQLAWAVAFGLLLGVVPHGNLLALILLVVVLSLKINHAMAALTAIGATFIATRLDPYSHQVGDFVLSNPQLNEAAMKAWALPLVPWTDLNNTVVMGSFLIGVGALLPVFMVTYPVFRFFQPAEDSESSQGDLVERSTDSRKIPEQAAHQDSHQVVMVDQGHTQANQPHMSPSAEPTASSHAQQQTNQTITRIDQGSVSPEQPKQIAVETRIDVIRMKDHDPDLNEASTPDANHEHQPMDEALNYLLRQLRDSQERKAA